MPNAQDSEPCGDITPHAEHFHGIFQMFVCPGVPEGTEYRLYAQGIKYWTQIRDEIAPAFRRDFPGVLVIADERVVYLSFPDPDGWRGASLELLGLEYRTAESIQRALNFIGNGPEIRALTEDETARVVSFRKELRDRA